MNKAFLEAYKNPYSYKKRYILYFNSEYYPMSKKKGFYYMNGKYKNVFAGDGVIKFSKESEAYKFLNNR